MRIFDPFEELRRMQERMSRLLEEFDRFAFEREITAPLDVIDEGDRFRIVVDLPGFNKEDINVYVENGDLVIKAERKEEKEEEGRNFIRKERKYGEVYRRVSLPSEVDIDKISAKYNNGVLEIIIPKVEKEKKVIKIE